ncbi:MAG: hypothetical protein KDD50_06555 [Bdellovibrionales bacterium]|nr:hypothetical protein [Bdellovibrionales bacterium]
MKAKYIKAALLLSCLQPQVGFSEAVNKDFDFYMTSDQSHVCVTEDFEKLIKGQVSKECYEADQDVYEDIFIMDRLSITEKQVQETIDPYEQTYLKVGKLSTQVIPKNLIDILKRTYSELDIVGITVVSEEPQPDGQSKLNVVAKVQWMNTNGAPGVVNIKGYVLLPTPSENFEKEYLDPLKNNKEVAVSLYNKISEVTQFSDPTIISIKNDQKAYSRSIAKKSRKLHFGVVGSDKKSDQIADMKTDELLNKVIAPMIAVEFLLVTPIKGEIEAEAMAADILGQLLEELKKLAPEEGGSMPEAEPAGPGLIHI